MLRMHSDASRHHHHPVGVVAVAAAGLLLLLLGRIANTVAASTPYNPNHPYCFRFTWIGPRYNNESAFQNFTCEGIVGDRAKVPCRQPLIVTDNGNLPNTTHIWDNYRSSVSDIACRLSPADVCVKYTYKYNHAVENITYMCGKVNVENEGAAASLCYTEFRNGREIEVCVCESRAGRQPCNTAASVAAWPLNSWLAVLLLWLGTAILTATDAVQWAPLIDRLIGGGVCVNV